MPSYKLNIGHVRAAAKDKDLAERLCAAGLPEDDRACGVLTCEDAPCGIKGVLVQRATKNVNTLDRKKKMLRKGEATTYNEMPFVIHTNDRIIKVRSGSVRVLDNVQEAIGDLTGEACTIEAVAMELVPSIVKISTAVEDFKLLSCKMADYFTDEETGGPYQPKFKSPARGLEFIQDKKYTKHIESARVKFKGKAGKVTVTLVGAASFAYSCKKDDEPAVTLMLEDLALAPSKIKARDAGPLFPSKEKDAETLSLIVEGTKAQVAAAVANCNDINLLKTAAEQAKGDWRRSEIRSRIAWLERKVAS